MALFHTATNRLLLIKSSLLPGSDVAITTAGTLSSIRLRHEPQTVSYHNIESSYDLFLSV